MTIIQFIDNNPIRNIAGYKLQEDEGQLAPTVNFFYGFLNPERNVLNCLSQVSDLKSHGTGIAESHAIIDASRQSEQRRSSYKAN